MRNRKTIRPNAISWTVDCSSNVGGRTGSVFGLLPQENATRNYVKVVQRMPVRIDFDRSPGQEFNAEGFLKPGWSVEPNVKVR